METPERGAWVEGWIRPLIGGGLIWVVFTVMIGAATSSGPLLAGVWGGALTGGVLGLWAQGLQQQGAWRDRGQWPLPTVPVALLAVNEEGRVANLNRTAELVLGWAAADARGKRVEMLVPGLGLRGQAAVMRTQRGTAMGTSWSCRARHRDGSAVEIRVSATLEAPGPGRVYALQEVGSRDPAAIEAREARARLIEGLATELRAPLNMASASCAIALADPGCAENPGLRGDLERIGGICARLQGLTGDLVDLARLQSGAVPIQPEDVPLDPLLASIAAELAGGPGAGLIVEGEVGVILRTDPERLRRILFQLVDPSAAGARPARLIVQTEEGRVRVEVRGPLAVEAGVGAELVVGLTELLGGRLSTPAEGLVCLELPLDAGWAPSIPEGDATTAPFGVEEDAAEEAAIGGGWT